MRALSLLAFIVIGAGMLLWLRSRDSPPPAPPQPQALPVIQKRPPVVSTRRFDPSAPPREMPALRAGEQAQCDSNFTSGALVGGRTRRTGAHTATVTITGVRMNLQLAIIIWVPEGVTQKVLEHEEGHRRISETYYATAEKAAERIAVSYIGKEIAIRGGDPGVEGNRALQRIGDEITAEYSRQIDPASAQLRYDAITDHARNDVLAADAATQVLSE